MQRALLLLVGLSLTSCAGCGPAKPPVAPVTGKVIYNGKPVPFGQVFFHPNAGTQGRGTIQADGTFTLTTYQDKDGAQIGTHKVRITSFEVQDPNGDPKRFAGGNGKSLIPEKYTSLTTTELTKEVQAGPNTFEFVLTD